MCGSGRKKEKKLRGVPGKGAEISRRGVAEWDGDAYRPTGLHLAKPRGSTRGGGNQTNELLLKKKKKEGGRGRERAERRMLYTEEVEVEEERRKGEEAGKKKMCSRAARRAGRPRPTLFGNRRTNALLGFF